MKRKRTKREKQVGESLKRIVQEMQLNSHELAGRFIDNCQTIETKMKLYINKKNKKIELKNLEGKTFGQILKTFKSYCKNPELIEWLENLKELRNDVAHTFFRDTRLLTKRYGGVVGRLNHKVLRKGIRMTEICFNLLNKTLPKRVT